jgi:hypothetical protein
LSKEEKQRNSTQVPETHTGPKPKPKSKKKNKHRRFIPRNKWQRIQDKKKRVTISAVYNYSDLELTDPIQKVLNRGLNFCVTPTNLNITEVLVDFRKFERKLKWKEFFADDDHLQDEEWVPDIFPVEKTNLPAKSSKNLKDF